MKVADSLYGEFEIDEPVLQKLVRSPSVQRLKGIAQYGMPPAYYPVPGFSRFEHSLGVMLLLRRLGADVEEQAAGLLHDVSHTAFSHVTDYVFTDDGGNHQDERHMAYFYATELPDILHRFGMDPERVATTGLHSLLEREAPDLCADRVDYSLREFALTTKNGIIKKTLSGVAHFHDRMVFTNREAAEAFAVKYLECHSNKWASVDKTVRQHLFASAIRSALDSGDITLGDLFMDDAHAMRKLSATRNPKVVSVLRLLSGKLELEECEKGDIVLPRRQRHVDPEYLERGSLLRLSRTSERYCRMLEAQREELSRGVSVRLKNIA
ncbi:MAG TPA: HD domain-containing protein [Candidatus Bilamarchaeum sp.]|nr:HD domain-containing protein [Candidatus Bilamarchaeum sp.]